MDTKTKYLCIVICPKKFTLAHNVFEVTKLCRTRVDILKPNLDQCMSQDLKNGRLVPFKQTKTYAYKNLGYLPKFLFLCDSTAQSVIFQRYMPFFLPLPH